LKSELTYLLSVCLPSETFLHLLILLSIFLDFAKALDKVPHHRLLVKLAAHGIEGRVANWIKSWLNGRLQRVYINGNSSKWLLASSGVPQGSVLWPLLFLIFINDLDCNIFSRIYRFAGDTKILQRINSTSDGLWLQQDIDTLGNWAVDWQMEFNVSKC
jgi:ribonucleases P/MRP protein subunit RPP40